MELIIRNETIRLREIKDDIVFKNKKMIRMYKIGDKLNIQLRFHGPINDVGKNRNMYMNVVCTRDDVVDILNFLMGFCETPFSITNR